MLPNVYQSCKLTMEHASGANPSCVLALKMPGRPLFFTHFINLVQDSSRPATAVSSSLSTVDPDVDDLYTKYKKLQKQLEFLKVQEEYIKDEQKNLKKELLHAQEEVKRIQSVPLVIGQFLEAVDQNTGIVGSTTGQ